MTYSTRSQQLSSAGSEHGAGSGVDDDAPAYGIAERLLQGRDDDDQSQQAEWPEEWDGDYHEIHYASDEPPPSLVGQREPDRAPAVSAARSTV